jgi:putative transposase
MKQIGRILTDCLDRLLISYRDLINDRSALFTRQFKRTLESGGVKTVCLPVRSPNLNSFAERYIRTIKQECLDRMILIGERSLQRVVDQFSRRYHHGRNHQGLDNKIIEPNFATDREGEVNCRDRLGGLLRYYHCETA